MSMPGMPPWPCPATDGPPLDDGPGVGESGVARGLGPGSKLASGACGLTASRVVGAGRSPPHATVDTIVRSAVSAVRGKGRLMRLFIAYG